MKFYVKDNPWLTRFKLADEYDLDLRCRFMEYGRNIYTHFIGALRAVSTNDRVELKNSKGETVYLPDVIHFYYNKKKALSKQRKFLGTFNELLTYRPKHNFTRISSTLVKNRAGHKFYLPVRLTREYNTWVTQANTFLEISTARVLVYPTYKFFIYKRFLELDLEKGVLKHVNGGKRPVYCDNVDSLREYVLAQLTTIFI